MYASLRFIAGLGLLVFNAVPVFGQPGEREQAIQALADRIDDHIDKSLNDRKIVAADRASDEEFLRRIYLDLAGRIPSVAEARRFLDDPRTERRQVLIAELLQRPAFSRHFARSLRNDWLPNAAGNAQQQFAANQLEVWLRDRLREGAPLDQLVRDQITAPSYTRLRGQQGVVTADYARTALLLASEFKPENLASTVSRAFLGIKLECAQCHDHPFAPYTQKQFWELAAFFAEVRPIIYQPSFVGPLAQDVGEIAIPGTGQIARARFFDGSEPRSQTGLRDGLADWLTRADNPYFARNLANRLWAHCFGVGLIDPIDEPGEENPPSHPGLLDDLARSLARENYDVRFLLAAITRSRTYQRSSRITGELPPARTFARAAVRGLTPEQLFDSLAQATLWRDPTPTFQRLQGINTLGVRAEFLMQFAGQTNRTDVQATILQALKLMNGSFVNQQTNAAQADLLASVIDAPFLIGDDKLETLYLATLSRRPTAEESRRIRAYLDAGGKRALADVLWALLNSSEFYLNH